MPTTAPAVRASSAAPRRPKFDSLEQQAYLNLWRTYDRLRAAEDELFGAYDLTAQQYNVLRLLRGEHPGTLPTLELAGRLISRAPDITRMLDHLERRALIERLRLAENRRVVRVGITRAGLALLRKLDRPVRNCHERQLGHLPAAQLRQLIDLLEAARQPHESAAGPWAAKQTTSSKQET
ncbi:MAG TPA: MarR family transcriptional regulator [Pirellulales bacterium]|nr:MarR family transcriptional regulator [Pirellulales bacterium]